MLGMSWRGPNLLNLAERSCNRCRVQGGYGIIRDNLSSSGNLPFIPNLHMVGSLQRRHREKLGIDNPPPNICSYLSTRYDDERTEECSCIADYLGEGCGFSLLLKRGSPSAMQHFANVRFCKSGASGSTDNRGVVRCR